MTSGPNWENMFSQVGPEVNSHVRGYPGAHGPPVLQPAARIGPDPEVRGGRRSRAWPPVLGGSSRLRRGFRVEAGGARYAEFRVEAFNLLNHPSFGPPARDISVPNTFGIITNTISSPRVIELVLKFYF